MSLRGEHDFEKVTEALETTDREIREELDNLALVAKLVRYGVLDRFELGKPIDPYLPFVEPLLERARARLETLLGAKK